jgi:hypothetical protein
MTGPSPGCSEGHSFAGKRSGHEVDLHLAARYSRIYKGSSAVERSRNDSKPVSAEERMCRTVQPEHVWQDGEIGALVTQLDTVSNHLSLRLDEFIEQHGYWVLSGKPLKAAAATELALLSGDCQLLRQVAETLKKVIPAPAVERPSNLDRLNN